MNKQLYRIIFSKTQQRLVVVSEIATREGKAKGEGQQNSMVSDRTVFDRTLPFCRFICLDIKNTEYGIIYGVRFPVCDLKCGC